jgi:hypothetical protein
MANEEKNGKTRLVLVVLRSKHFFGSLIWYCICKQLTFVQFYKNKIDVDPCRVKKFFPSWTRWYQIKWFKGDLDKRVTMTKTEEALLKKNPGTTLSRYSSCGNLVYAALFDEGTPEHADKLQHPYW